MMKSAPGQAVDQALAVGQRVVQRRVIANPVTIVKNVFDGIDGTPFAVSGLRGYIFSEAVSIGPQAG